MSHMDAVGKIINRPHSPAAAVQVMGRHCHRRHRHHHHLLLTSTSSCAAVQWFFLVSDRTFVNVPQLLRLLGTLHSGYLSYFGQVASATHKESFGFHEHVT